MANVLESTQKQLYPAVRRLLGRNGFFPALCAINDTLRGDIAAPAGEVGQDRHRLKDEAPPCSGRRVAALGAFDEALPALLRRLKTEGYKVVQMKAKAPVQTLPQYDEELLKDAKLPTVSSRPVSSVVQTISE